MRGFCGEHSQLPFLAEPRFVEGVLRTPSLFYSVLEESLLMGNKLYVGNLPYGVRDADLDVSKLFE